MRAATLGIWLIIAAGLAVSWAATNAENPKDDKPAKDGYAEQVRPVLAKHCFACHGEKKQNAKLNLESFSGRVEPHAWKPVWERLRSRQMPPADQPQPTAAERERLLNWIEASFAAHTLDGHPDPGPLRPRRLNVREHMNTFRDLAFAKDGGRPRRVSYTPKPDGSINLYHAVVPPPEHPCAFVPRHLPQDTNDGGFDTVGDNLTIAPFLVEKYLRCAKTLLDESLNAKQGGAKEWPLFQNVTRLRTGPFPKGVTQRQAVAAYLKDFASRAFHRPVTAEDVEKYAKLYDAALERGDDFDSAIRLPLQAVLTSPRFTVLWAGTAASAREKDAPVRPLDDYELAARLSYFLWSSIPDRELLVAAQQGKLQDPDVLEQHVRLMLKDQRVTDGLLAGFLCQWLQLDRLDRAAPDVEQYASYFQNNLAELMRAEVLLFADAMLVEDHSILEFVDADWGFLCYPLAQHYGVENFPGKKQPANAQPTWYRVKFPTKQRGGVLTMGKVLTGTSQPLRTSPVHRGKWVLEAILGTPPPPPPPDVDNVLKEEQPEGKARLTVPQLMARHRDNPACASCHRMIDPLGLAFENFDPVGRWRDRDQDQPVVASGTLVDGKKFNGVVELKALLIARKDEFTRNFVEQMLTYALGRKLEFYDVATVKRITEVVAKDDYKLSRVVVEVVKSYPFRNLRTGDNEPMRNAPAKDKNP